MSTTDQPVIVGYDGSEQGKIAIQWAARTAQRRRTSLAVVSVTEWSEPIPALRNDDIAAQAQRHGQSLAEQGGRLAREHAAGLTVTTDGLVGNVAQLLVERSRQAQLLVVGRRGRRNRRGTLPGSVAYTLANQAQCPVAIVHGSLYDMPTWYYPSVVAVDGSRSSLVALDVAARWAAESQTLLRIVVAWKIGFLDHQGDFEAPRASKAQANAERIARDATDKVRANHPLLQVESVVRQGRAADVILSAAADASLIIMGARGRGTLASLFMGSVSREVMARAECPIYIIR